MAAEDGNIIRGIYTGEEEVEEFLDEYGDLLEIILLDTTHVSVHDSSITAIRRHAFNCHPNIVELICHHALKKIEYEAFSFCPSLKRLMIPGVEEVGGQAFYGSGAVRFVACDKLEIIRLRAFGCVSSLESINLPSARIVERYAFENCEVLRDVKFGKSLDSLKSSAFLNCPSLERITIPLKKGLFEDYDVFTGCNNLKRVNLVEDEVLHEAVDALLMEEWRQEMRNVIDSINHILPDTPAGLYDAFDAIEVGGKVRAIREWIALVLRKIIHYKGQHRSLLNEAATVLQLDLPNDIVQNNVLAFLELPSYTFDGEDDGRMIFS